MMLRTIIITAVVLSGLDGKAAEPDFAVDVRPLLSDACYNCHGPDAAARNATNVTFAWGPFRVLKSLFQGSTA